MTKNSKSGTMFNKAVFNETNKQWREGLMSGHSIVTGKNKEEATQPC